MCVNVNSNKQATPTNHKIDKKQRCDQRDETNDEVKQEKDGGWRAGRKGGERESVYFPARALTELGDIEQT
jgi:hypothetical protein